MEDGCSACKRENRRMSEIKDDEHNKRARE